MEWSPAGEHSVLCTAREGHGSATVDGRVFVCGGAGDDGDLLDTVEVLDEPRATWSIVTSMQLPRGGLLFPHYRACTDPTHSRSLSPQPSPNWLH